MSKSLKVIAIITMIVLVIGAAATVVVMIASYDPENPGAGFYLDGKRIKDPGTMFTIGNHQISFDEYRYYYLTQKYYASAGDASYWISDLDGQKAKSLKEETEKSIRTMYAWLDLATEKGVGLSQQERDTIANDIKKEKQELGTEFAANLRKNFLANETTYIRITEMQTLAQKIQKQYKEDSKAEFEAQALEKVATVKHILFTFDTQADDPAQNEADTLARTQEVMQEFDDELGAEIAKAQAEKDGELTEEETLQITQTLFEAYRVKYSEDPGQTEKGYTFGEGQMMQEFYDASIAATVGQITEPVRTDYGYHIIMRLPLDTEYLEVEANREQVLDAEISKIADENMQERAAAFVLTPGPYYDKVSIVTVK